MPSSDPAVAPWIRLATIVTLAIPQLVTGLWGVVAPRSWFDTFPGIGPALVAAEPPYNAHLASDAAAGFLATGILLVGAVVFGHRSHLLLGLLGYAAYSVPHTLYHLANAAPGLTGAENALNVVTLFMGLALAAGLAVACLRSTSAQRAPSISH